MEYMLKGDWTSQYKDFSLYYYVIIINYIIL